jgi:O-antigen/teichoic acid export membrane protein
VRIAPAFLQTFTVQLIQTAASIVTGILIARGLGPSGQGQFAFFAALIAFTVIVASFGQFEGNVLSSAGRSGAGRVLLTRALAHAALVVVVLFGLFALWKNAPGRRALGDAIMFFPVILGLEVHAQLLRGINLGQHHIAAYNVAALIQRLMNLLGIVLIAASASWDIRNVLWAWAIAATLGVAISSIWIWLRSDPARIRLPMLLAAWGASLRRGARALVTIAFTVLLVRCDIWMLRAFLGPSTVGQMSVASTLAEWLWYVPSILGNVLFAAAAADRVTAALQITRAARAVTALVLPAGLVLMLVGRFVVPLMYGSAYGPAGLLFVVLIPGMMAIAIHLVVDSYFAGKGFPAISIWSAVGALSAKVGLNLVAIPLWGAAGAAGVTTLVYSGLLVVKVLAFSRETGTSVRALLIPTRQDLTDNAKLARAWLAAKLTQRSA